MRIVDHQERRREIAEVAMDLIAREGLEAATLNRIAREMGASIRVITHYFSSKDTLLLWAYRTMAEQGQQSIAAALAGDPADLAGVLKAMCGGDAAALRRWRVYVAFWDMATRHPDFAAEQRQWIDRTQQMIGDVLAARAGGDAQARIHARELIALVYGVSVQRLFDPSSWNETAIAEAIDRAVSRI